MPQLQSSLYQRTAVGRNLYGRVRDFRRKHAYIDMINSTKDIGSVNPTAGAAPLAVDHIIANVAAATAPARAGGTVSNSSGYARTNGASAITVSRKWYYGDTTVSASVALNSTTNKSYNPAGTYVTKLTCVDCLGRSIDQTMTSIVAS